MRNPKAVQENFAAVWNAATLIKSCSYEESVARGSLSGGFSKSLKDSERFARNYIGNSALWNATVADRIARGCDPKKLRIDQLDYVMPETYVSSPKWMRINQVCPELEQKEKLAKRKNHKLEAEGRLTTSWPTKTKGGDGFIPTRCIATHSRGYMGSEMPAGAYELIVNSRKKEEKREISGAYRQALAIVEAQLRRGDIVLKSEAELHCLIREVVEEIGGGQASLDKEEEKAALSRFL
jgi:hypothetical protein